MSFGKLLAAGRSWVGGDGVGRYRMRNNIQLPKFISPRNPFKTEPTADPDQGEPGLPQIPTAKVTGRAAVEKRSFVLQIANGFERVVMFCVDHNPFSRVGRSRLPAMPHFGKRPVQGELSLDQVKVMRGDLVCADLEVVTAGGDGRSMNGSAWKSLTTRIFAAINK
jgi:hypothetical protein